MIEKVRGPPSACRKCLKCRLDSPMALFLLLTLPLARERPCPSGPAEKGSVSPHSDTSINLPKLQVLLTHVVPGVAAYAANLTNAEVLPTFNANQTLTVSASLVQSCVFSGPRAA